MKNQGLKTVLHKKCLFQIWPGNMQPTISATLEFLKFSTNTILPTHFYEAQLDYFGKHMFGFKSEPAGVPETGKHHFEWKPAYAFDSIACYKELLYRANAQEPVAKGLSGASHILQPHSHINSIRHQVSPLWQVLSIASALGPMYVSTKS